MGQWMDGCWTLQTTPSASAFTKSRTSPFWRPWRATTRRSITTSPRSWRQPSLTACLCLRRKLTGWTTALLSASLPTIFDSLSTAGVSARYYYNNLPFPRALGIQVHPHRSSLPSVFVRRNVWEASRRFLCGSALYGPGSATRRTTTNRIPTFAGAMRFFPPPSRPWRRAPPGIRPCSSSRLTKAAAFSITLLSRGLPRRIPSIRIWFSGRPCWVGGFPRSSLHLGRAVTHQPSCDQHRI